MALERVFLETWGEKKEKGLFRFVLWNGGKETPHTHDMNMEGKERKNNGGERKRKMPRFSNLLPSWRTSGTCVCVYVYLYLKSRNHELLKELKELDSHHSIIEGASLMSR